MVRNHLLTTRLIAVVDTDKDEVRIIVDPEVATRAQDRELLDGEPGYDPTRVESVHDQVRDEAVLSPLVDGERAGQDVGRAGARHRDPVRQRVEADPDRSRRTPRCGWRRRWCCAGGSGPA